MIYEVEANVGGKIAQVGSRLIDMTAKKMADIFFGKFSEIVSEDVSSSDDNSDEQNIQIEGQTKTKNQNHKILIYAGIALTVAILIYTFI